MLLNKYILISIYNCTANSSRSISTNNRASSSWAWNILIRLVLVPILQDVTNARGVGKSVHILEVLLGELEWLGGNVGNVLPDQLAGIDARLVDLLEQEGSEGLDA